MSEQNLDDAVAIQRALMRSASTDVISPKEWWTRATTAIETAAAAADTWTGFVTRAAKKLQIEVLGEESSTVLTELGDKYSDPAVFEELRSFIQREAIYVTAINRAERAAQRQKKEEQNA